MYKLVIIDDEPIIRQGLKTIIEWEQYGIEVAGEADNGVDGLRLCEALKPDIAVVDIKMPGLDGLQMVEAAKEMGLETDFIILSGYSEFQYAQRATEFGVRSYLLKPIEQEDLLKRVVSLREQWASKRRSREQLEDSRRLLAERALRKLLRYDGRGAELEAGEEEALSSLPGWPWPSYQLALIAEERRGLQPEEMSWLLTGLREEPFFREGCALQAGAYLVLLAPEIHPSDILYGCTGLREARQRFRLEPVLTLGPRVLQVEQLELSYRFALENMRNKFFYDRLDSIIVPQSRPEEGADGREGPPLEHCAEEAAKAVAARDRVKTAAVLAEAEQAMLRSGWKEERIKSGYIAIYAELVRLLASANEQIRGLCPSLREVVEGINRQVTLPSVREYMMEQLADIMDRWSKDKKSSNLLVILEYIAGNLSSDLKLESLAEKFHYNSSYLGKLFRAQTGESFNAYLDRIRIEKAKQLLAGGEKVYEVAAMVGYCSVDYFHVKFKKLTGEAPSAYKKKWELGSP